MKKGKFYAVGIGPGDPDLITVKAIKTIGDSDVVVVPKSGAEVNIALTIAGKYLENKTIIESYMPMTKDKDKLDKYHNESAQLISSMLNDGKTVSFLTLGDPSIYSTVMYVHRKLKNEGFDTGIISGVPSFCAVAASLDTSLCEREEMLHIIPATFKGTDEMNLSGTKVFMKSGKTIMDMKDVLKGKKAMMVERATMADEKVYYDFQSLEEPSSYFSIIVVPSEERDI